MFPREAPRVPQLPQLVQLPTLKLSTLSRQLLPTYPHLLALMLPHSPHLALILPLSWTGLPLPPEVLETYRLPPWISPELVEVMKLAIPGKLWEAIICLWLELECCAEVTNGVRCHSLPVNGVLMSSQSLPTAHRPEQVAFWIKAKHLPLKIPKGVTASGMASTWRVWWYTIQPAW